MVLQNNTISRYLVLIYLLLCSFSLCADPKYLIDTKSDQVYGKVGDVELQLDLFQPKASGPFPGILILHGGGWLGGSRKKFENLSRELSAQGYVVANADYRLATEAKFPGAVSDAKAAVRWMRAHAKELKLNPNMIFGAGFSAGGHLISMLATTAGKFEGNAGWKEYSSELQGALVMGAGVDQIARVEETKNREVKNCIIFFGGGIDEKREVYEQGSPIYHVNAKTAPMFFYDGELDRPGERYIEMRKKMDRYKVFNDFAVLPKLKHGAWNKPEFRPAVVAQIDTFITRLSK